MVKVSWQRVANSVSHVSACACACVRMCMCMCPHVHVHVSACVDSDINDDDDDDDGLNNRVFKIQRRGRQRERQKNNWFN